MKRFLVLLALFFPFGLMAGPGQNLNWNIAYNGGSHSQDVDTVTLNISVSATTPNGQYQVYGVPSWSGSSPEGSGTASAVVLATFTVSGTSSKTVTLNSGGSYVMSVDAMNTWCAYGDGPTSYVQQYPNVYTGSLVMTITKVVYVSSAATVPFSASPTAYTDSYTVWFSQNSTLVSPQSYTGTQTVAVNGTALPNQPLTLNCVNQSAFSETVYVTLPGGAGAGPVAVGTVPANSSATLTYTPLNGVTTGTYGIEYGQTVGGVSAQMNVVTSDTLTASGGTTYTDTWSAPNVNITMTGSGSGANNGSPNGKVVNNTTSAVSTVWKDAAGNVVATGPTIAAGATYSVDGTTLPALGAGQTQTVSLYNSGTGQLLGTVTQQNLGDGYGTTTAGTVSATINPTSTASTTPVTGQTNGGNTPNGTTTAGTTPTTLVNNGTTSISGTANGATNQDLYNDVKTALVDAANGTAGAPAPTSTPGSLASAISNRGHLDDVEGQIDTGVTNMGTIQTTLTGSITNLSNTSWIPTSFGSATSLDCGTIPWIGGTTYHLVFDFTPWLSTASIVRQLALFMLTVLFVILMISTIRAAIN